MDRMKTGKQKGYKDTSDIPRLVERTLSTRQRLKLLAELAKGVQVERYERDRGNRLNKEPKIYTQPPDREAIRMLNEMQYPSLKAKQPDEGPADGKTIGIIFLPAGPQDNNGRIALPQLTLTAPIAEASTSETSDEQPQNTVTQPDARNNETPT